MAGADTTSNGMLRAMHGIGHPRATADKAMVSDRGLSMGEPLHFHPGHPSFPLRVLPTGGKIRATVSSGPSVFSLYESCPPAAKSGPPSLIFQRNSSRRQSKSAWASLTKLANP